MPPMRAAAAEDHLNRFRLSPAHRAAWTRTRSHRAIVQAGILTGRYELLDGEIIVNMSQNPPHSYVVSMVMNWLVALFGPHVRIQSAISVADADPDHNDPEPDAVVTISPASDFAARHPGPADLHIVVEVADSTLRSDRVAKAALYARAGIGEYWIVDIVGRQLFVHRQPLPNGYADITVYSPDEFAAPLARPNDVVRVARPAAARIKSISDKEPIRYSALLVEE